MSANNKEFEYLDDRIKTLEFRIAHPNEYNLTPTIKVRINDGAVYKEEVKTLIAIKQALTEKQNLERFTRLVVEKSFNFDRFRYALRHWNTTEEQLDVYNSGIGNVYKYDKDEFAFIKEMIAKYGKRI